ncbi:L-rhamnose mutarotase [Seonamhaeicola sp.]|uniref:L-rhamnose mutarotase n=1 Tax=Seonamhaeicola sp. TaxID=1912245 RepID=UPI002613BF57|nr:L-rhamnose mutarotase [Seonamhaeicola sp.]
MKTYFKTFSLLFTLFLLVSCNSTTNSPENEKITKRVGMVIKLKPESIEEYKKLHADSNPGVRDLLTKYGMRNFSIFLQEINGEYYEFGYYEYVGNDFEADMKKMGEEERTIAWLKVCDPMQIPLEGSNGWTEMERVYFNP